jgi:hypothetical protein
MAMIQRFCDRFIEKKEELAKMIREDEPSSYKNLFEMVCKVLYDDDDPYMSPNYQKVHRIDDGHYQGTLLFVVPADDYQPSTYWATKVGYGSCSACDTFQGIQDQRGWDDEEVTDQQVEDYLRIALHLVQEMKEI